MKEGKIDELKKRLYGRIDTSALRLRRRKLHEQSTEISQGWEKPDALPVFTGMQRTKVWIPKLFLFSVLFFVIALGISFFFFFGGTTTVSSQNILIDIRGPSTIGGGEVLPLQITVLNRNTVPLELADLLVEFPDGTRSADSVTTPLPRTRVSLGTIAAGGQKNTAVSAILFGAEHSAQEIKVTVEYRLQGSNAIFHKDEVYNLALSSAPLRLTVKALKEVISGQEINFVITAESNATAVLKKILLVAEFPFGFTFKSADPKPTFGNSVWQLGDLPVGGKRTITIRGVMSGEEGDERTMRFQAGVAKEEDEKKLATAFVTDTETLIVRKPFIAADIALNGGRSSEYVTGSGKTIRADVSWTNNLATPVTDAEIEVVLGGEALDKNSVTVERGFYNSAAKTILWSKGTDSEFASIEPGATESASFTFSSLSLAKSGSLRNPQITLTVNVRGRRASDQNVPESISETASRIVKVTSDLLLSSRAVYFSGPFTNTGSLPPKAEKETTYTVIWTLTNSSNTVTNTVVKASLPPSIRWLGVIIPASLSSGENLQFNPVGGTIIWTIDSLRAGVGYTTAPREVAFQIGFTPSVSQIGSAPIIVNEQTIQGFDQFTDGTITDTRPALTTNLVTDPTFRTEQSQVVQ